jgi:hypothetical protein
MFAHAWVDVDGQAIGEPEDISERFALLQGNAQESITE